MRGLNEEWASVNTLSMSFVLVSAVMESELDEVPGTSFLGQLHGLLLH